MRAVWKYPLDMLKSQHDVPMPARAEILAVQTQTEVPCIWALVDPSQPPESRRFVIVGTGHPFEFDGVTAHHVGTFQLMGGSFIGHLFELRPPPSGEEKDEEFGCSYEDPQVGDGTFLRQAVEHLEQRHGRA